MKINAFHIKNYRSIIDTGKRYLSPDNITALIGQNESGKTSVLEALRSFYDGKISDDVVRSDQRFPQISCTFILEENDHPEQWVDVSSLPAELQSSFSGKQEITLTRTWIDTHESRITPAEPEIIAFYTSLENNKAVAEKRIKSSIPDLTRQTEITAKSIDSLEKDLVIIKNELNSLTSQYEGCRKLIGKSKNPEQLVKENQDLETLRQQLTIAEAKQKEKQLLIETRKSTLQELAEKLNNCKSFVEIYNRTAAVYVNLKDQSNLLRNTSHHYELSSSQKEARQMLRHLEQLKSLHRELMEEWKSQTEYLSIRRRIADKILDGKIYKEAESEAVRENEIERSFISPEEMGAQLFRFVPIFEFFEDFSSLLPNKIDLEDLLNENTQVEGYKAARNFLCVAGLNAEFFREENHRILKQKIENLNSEITVDFQDYWRQSVGKNDKIRIHFEQEHYDYTHPEKSGKPYLEFWIKDKQERLYPKQRSRGVRWFLSFYLELKATAKQNSRNRIILIDEPGLSLHARAQEDVLKVFEDLRENLQIIYCTHSPNLIDLQKLYRIMAVQRAKDEDERSETIVLDSHCLHEASSDTLMPIYSLMGTRLNDKQFIFPKHNLIVEDIITFYYLDTMFRIAGVKEDVHFLPSSGAENIPVLANMLFGWKIDFGLLTMDNTLSNQIAEILIKNTFFKNEELSGKKIRCLKGYPFIEDLFSTIDFKRFILKQRIGITIRNSEYIENNKLSRILLATDFCSKVQNEGLKFHDFDEETQRNFKKGFDLIKSILFVQPLEKAF